MYRVHLIHWRPSEAAPLIDTVRAAGVQVDYCEQATGPAVTSAIRESPPDAVLIDLSRLPSQGKEVAVWLRGRKATCHVPILFIGGDAEKVSKIQQLLPDAVFTQPSALVRELKSLPREVKHPVIPLPMMQRHANRTALQKMGVKEGAKVSVIDAPRDYLTVLGEVPAGAELIEDAPHVCEVSIWFLREPEAFLAALPVMRRLAAQSRLWVLWRKGSKNGMSQNFVREAGIDAGLVDYKICSVDGHWSGIAFARRKK